MPSPDRHHRGSHKRTRSASPSRKSHATRRSRSPKRKHHEDRSSNPTSDRRKPLPFKATELNKRDLESHREIFALYLDVQKQIDIFALEESEVKGRWKSFVRKWNERDLAEGWYDPSTKQKADQQAALNERGPIPTGSTAIPDFERDENDDEVGPAAPAHVGSASRFGPKLPTSHDLEYRDEIIAESRMAAREDIRYERKLERRQEKERLEELVPRADAGTRERQLEKKREITASRALYREARSPGAEEINESDLIGDNGLDDYKRKKNEEEKKKTERQVRKEEIWRAKAEERREKLEVMKNKEDKTLEMLKGLAKQRYG